MLSVEQRLIKLSRMLEPTRPQSMTSKNKPNLGAGKASQVVSALAVGQFLCQHQRLRPRQGAVAILRDCKRL